MYVCMYVCMHACMYYVCVYVFKNGLYYYLRATDVIFYWL